MKERVLAVLKSNNDYVSGQELCDSLGVSRTAVWKVINSLKDSGYEIESVRNRGYRLVSCPNVLYANEIKTMLDTKWFGNKIYYFEEIDSTNNEIKRNADQEDEGLLAIAEKQTAGKGRRGRTWESPSGTGIWMSFLLKPHMGPDKISMVTLVAALACAKAITEVTGLDARIKWPNDIVINGKKIVGILTEMSAEIDYINYVVVGIGINANTEFFPEEIAETASSLKIEGGGEVSRSAIVAAFGKYFEKYYKTFEEDESLVGLREAYEALLVNKDNEVAILEGDSRRVGRAVGINNLGELVFEGEDGNVENIRAGEVSVRGIYGYV